MTPCARSPRPNTTTFNQPQRYDATSARSLARPKNRTLRYLCGQRVRVAHLRRQCGRRLLPQQKCHALRWQTGKPTPVANPYELSAVTHPQQPEQKLKHPPSARNVTMTAWLFGHKIRRQLGQQPRIPTTPVWGKVRSEKNPQHLDRFTTRLRPFLSSDRNVAEGNTQQAVGRPASGAYESAF